MKVKLPDGTIITGVDQADVINQVKAAGIPDPVLYFPAVKGTVVTVIEK